MKTLSFDDFLVAWDDDHKTQSVKRFAFDQEEFTTPKPNARNIETATPEELEDANRWYEACKPVIEVDRPPWALYRAAAKTLDVHPSTIRRAIKRYRENDNSILALLRPPADGGRGGIRLADEVYAILQGVIEDYYLTLKSRSINSTYEEMVSRFRAAGLEDKAPHYNTLRIHLGKVDPRERVRRRKGERVVREQMDPIKGEFPLGKMPLDTVLIDHHICDVEIVDEIHRKTIGRPWLTLAIDAYSRMIVGLYLSLDPPCANNVGLCLINAFMPKEPYLKWLGVEGEWPVWGLFRQVHSDNGKEFRNRMLKRACSLHGIETMFRPVRTPHYGSYVESMCRTISIWLKNVEGATYSNPKERGTENRGGTPTMTLREFERWLVTRIIGRYHLDVHSGIGMPPAVKWHNYFFPKGAAPEPLPEPIKDPRRLRLDLMPFVERTVQRYGLRINDIYYMSDNIKHLIAEPGKKARTFIVRYNPAEMSPVWLWDPDLKTYHEVGYRDASRPVLSKWELAAASKKAEESGMVVNENTIFDTADRLRKIEVEAAIKTKKARRSQARKKSHADRQRLVPVAADPAPPPVEIAAPPEPGAPRRIFSVRIRD
ncbi:MAG TPA: Mu transposase C-terminal domain-containing protein [Magnetospirillaceae bacterium]